MQLSSNLTLGASARLGANIQKLKDSATSARKSEAGSERMKQKMYGAGGGRLACQRLSSPFERGAACGRGFQLTLTQRSALTAAQALREERIVKTGFVAISGTSSSHGNNKQSIWCGRMRCLCHKSPLPNLWKIHHVTSLHPSKSCLDYKYFLSCRWPGVMFQCILL